MTFISRATALALLSLFSGLIVAVEAGGQISKETLVDKVRTANVRFKDVAAAVAEGYAPIPCASGIDGGAMGVHYVRRQAEVRPYFREQP